MFTEVKVLQALRHPNIIKLKESYKTHSNKLVLILEHAEGGDLKARINSRKGQFFSEEQVRRRIIRLDFAVMPRAKILPRAQSAAPRP